LPLRWTTFVSQRGGHRDRYESRTAQEIAVLEQAPGDRQQAIGDRDQKQLDGEIGHAATRPPRVPSTLARAVRDDLTSTMINLEPPDPASAKPGRLTTGLCGER
jgi:hypothetical protein